MVKCEAAEKKAMLLQHRRNHYYADSASARTNNIQFPIPLSLIKGKGG